MRTACEKRDMRREDVTKEKTLERQRQRGGRLGTEQREAPRRADASTAAQTLREAPRGHDAGRRVSAGRSGAGAGENRRASHPGRGGHADEAGLGGRERLHLTPGEGAGRRGGPADGAGPRGSATKESFLEERICKDGGWAPLPQSRAAILSWRLWISESRLGF